MAVVDGELQSAKLLRAVYSDRQLEEVLTDFWFNHFNVFIGKGADRYLVTSYERDVIRPHVLGKFKDLLVATAQSPAMLFYLDNWQSVGPHSDEALGIKSQNVRSNAPVRPGGTDPLGRIPWLSAASATAARKCSQPQAQQKRRNGLNENYARELMELAHAGREWRLHAAGRDRSSARLSPAGRCRSRATAAASSSSRACMSQARRRCWGTRSRRAARRKDTRC